MNKLQEGHTLLLTAMFANIKAIGTGDLITEQLFKSTTTDDPVERVQNQLIQIAAYTNFALQHPEKLTTEHSKPGKRGQVYVPRLWIDS